MNQKQLFNTNCFIKTFQKEKGKASQKNLFPGWQQASLQPCNTATTNPIPQSGGQQRSNIICIPKSKASRYFNSVPILPRPFSLLLQDWPSFSSLVSKSISILQKKNLRSLCEAFTNSADLKSHLLTSSLSHNMLQPSWTSDGPQIAHSFQPEEFWPCYFQHLEISSLDPLPDKVLLLLWVCT